MAYYDALVAKWATLTGTTQQKLDAINALTVSLPAGKTIVAGYDLYNAINDTEYSALSAANKAIVDRLTNFISMDASSGTRIRAQLLAMFAAGTTTRANLAALDDKATPKVLWWSATVAQGGGGLSSPVTQADLVAAGGLT